MRRLPQLIIVLLGLGALVFLARERSTIPPEYTPARTEICQDKIGAIQAARDYIKTKTKDQIIRFETLNPGTVLGITDKEKGCIVAAFSSYCFKSKSGEKQRNFRVGIHGSNNNWKANNHAFDVFGGVKTGCDF